MRRIAIIGALAILLTACGGSSTSTPSYDATASQAPLTKAGWKVKTGTGMRPLAGGKQLGWLDLVSPTGTKISLQFLESSGKAKDELAAIHAGVSGVKADPSFRGTTVGNVLAFTTPTGRQELSAIVVSDLGKLLAKH